VSALKGELQQLGKKEEAIEPLFNDMLLKFFKKRVTFRQVVTITQDATLSGYLEFMTCDDRQCLAPEAVDFSFELIADEAGSGSTNLIPGNTTLLEPVKWKVYSEKINDTIYKLHFDASIDNGWKLYGQSIPPKGPTPTKFRFTNKGTGYELDGKVLESANVERKKEPLFDNMVLSFFKHDAQFTQTIRLTDTAAVVNGYFEFMTCDATQCLPADRVDFSIDLKSGKALEVIDTSGITEVKKVDFRH
jgi:hypothetical protein